MCRSGQERRPCHLRRERRQPSTGRRLSATGAGILLAGSAWDLAFGAEVPGDPRCWGFGDLTYERCCLPRPADNPCWDSFFTPERCCGSQEAAAAVWPPRAIEQLREELFTDVDPYRLLEHPCGRAYSAQKERYPDSHLTPTIVRLVLAWLGKPPALWLEVGSFVGNSAITTADTLKELGAPTGLVCVDPFTGMVDMWNTRKGLRLHLNIKERNLGTTVADGALLMDEFGHSRIYEMFLANIRHAGHQDMVMPMRVSSITGMRILQDLFNDRRIEDMPQVIYLDSAHEPNETLLEVREAWRTLQAPGVLFGDDWSWPGVRQDVAIFAEELGQRPLAAKELAHFDWPSRAATQPVPGLAVVDQDDGVWFLLKEG